MSKSISGHFKSTQGFINHPAYSYSQYEAKMYEFSLKEKPEPYPLKYKQLSSKKLKSLRDKKNNRTITKKEYKILEWHKRLAKRRNEGIDKFWIIEKKKLQAGLPGTRHWTEAQITDILNNKRPKYNNQTINSHHTYSVKDYPHLANRHDLIYPVTPYEHLYGWHGGNFSKSSHGKPVKNILQF